MPGSRRRPEMRILFHGVPQPVRFADCGNLLALLPRFFSTWPYREASETSSGEPVITVYGKPDGEYATSAPWLDGPLCAPSETGALNNLAVDLVNAYFRFNATERCMHAAGAEFSNRLVIFPNTNKSGKSLLIAGLIRAGVKTFGDDLIATSPDFTGMSFGIPPRLRKPLPASEPDLDEYVAGRVLVEDRWYCYLDVSEPGLAPFGRRKPVGALVVLDRRDGAAASLTRLDSASAVYALAGQQFMRQGEAAELLAHSRSMTGKIPCWNLRYSRVSEAIRVLAEAFDAPTPNAYDVQPPTSDAGPPVLRRGKTHAAAKAKPSRVAHLRSESVRETVLAEEVFLAGPDNDALFRLNPLGRMVWDLLASPVSAAEIADALAEFFPDEPRRRIEADVAGLFRDLRDNGLIRRRGKSSSGGKHGR